MLELQEKKPETKDEKKLRNYKYNQHYIFHPDHDPKLVNDEDYQEHLANGWYDSPSKFPKKELVSKAKVDEKEALIKQMQAMIDSQNKVIDELKQAQQTGVQAEKELVDAEGYAVKSDKKTRK